MKIVKGARSSEEVAKTAVQFEYKVREIAEEIQKSYQAPKGTYAYLSPLLDERRIPHCIPDAAFKQQMAYDRILVWQIAQHEGETVSAHSTIIAPQVTQHREHHEAPRGILIGAGLKALDNLRSNGIDLGHIVTIGRNIPWHMKIETIQGKDLHALLMRDGDVTGSEDLAKALRAGKCKIVVRESVVDGMKIREHLFQDEKGEIWNPTEPWIADDM